MSRKSRKRKFHVIIPSQTSPKRNTKACLCRDNTYSIECCKGDIRQQGIGNIDYSGEYVEVDYWADDYSV